MIRARPQPRSKHTRFLVLGAFAAMLVSAVAFGQERAHSRDTIDVDEITPGMRGYGLTVFRGTTPERFDVEVIDVMHNFRPGQDLILIRTPHPILEHAHVVAGMSGSPIYLDNRLAGAYAYGWPFTNEAVAGVTPIAAMLREMRRPYRTSSFPGALPIPPPSPRRSQHTDLFAPSTSRFAGLPPYLGDTEVTATTAFEAHAARLGLGDRASNAIVPAATPLLVGGMSDGAVQMLEGLMGDLGMMVLQTGGGGNTQTPSGPTAFSDGSAVGVELIRGDISATAVGTVTHVDGPHIAAFGHPMLNAGEIGLPTALARVIHVLSSEERSFKIAEPIRSIGMMVQDRQAGIFLDSSLVPATVPVTIRVLGVPDAPRTEWHVELASHRAVTPVMLATALVSALGATAADNDDVMYSATSRVWIAGRHDPVEVTDEGYTSLGAANALPLGTLRVFPILEMIYGNPFQEQRTERIEVDMSVRFARDTMRIVDASVASHDVDPGSTVPVRVVLRPYAGPEEVRVIPVTIPERAAGDNVEIHIQAGNVVDLVTIQPTDFEELLSTIHERYPATSMVVSLELPSRGIRFAGHVADHLPGSALDALQLRNDGDRNREFQTFDRHELPLGGPVVTGSARVELTVRERPRP